MIDHLTLTVSNLERSKKFYSAALECLGYRVLMEFGAEVTGDKGFVGMGADGKCDFWLAEGRPTNPVFHVAFRAKNRQQVHAFHKAALAVGGKDNGLPGPREHYHPNFYGAFVLDPDGQNVEVVCHDPA
jgi:catechol 2,3-dioxygenase-like lactoylglutathione lyase family enzyme